MLAQAAAAAAGHQAFPAAALYVVATPIGNLADLTLRAIHVLGLVDAVACEDTRVSGQLLHHLRLDKPLIALHQHNEREATHLVLARLAAGQRVAYASDAGTPALSDPGAALVCAAAQAGHRVLPVPGVSSVSAALSVAGDVLASGWRFVGFLPAKGQTRDAALADCVASADCQVVFEAPHRVTALAQALASIAPERRVTVCRELTKQFETVATVAAAALPGWLAADPQRLRGEFVLVLHAQPAPGDGEAEALEPATLRTLAVLQRTLPLKQAVALAAELTGAPRNRLYAQALRLREDMGAGEPS